jgi:hypothetical protein
MAGNMRLYSTPVLLRITAIEQRLASIDGKLNLLLKGEGIIMATEADLNAKLDLVAQAIANEIATAKADIQAAIDQGKTPAEIGQATMDRLDAMKTTLDEAFAPAAPAPATA